MDTDNLVFAFVLFLRVGVPLLIPRFPLPAMLAALVIDGVDQTIFQKYTDLDLTSYQSYDKALDIYYLAIAYLSSMRNWSYHYAFRINQFLFYYRMVGVLLFELLNVRALLLIFPNTFEYFFDFYEGVRTRWDPRRMTKYFVLGAAAFIWIFIKLPQEWWIHIAQLDTTDLIKEDIFGVPVDTAWSTIVSDNIGVFVGLAIAIVALILGIRWYAMHKLPAPSWPLTFDADAPGRDTTPILAASTYQRAPRNLFGPELFEKICMIVLVSVIFSQIIPDVSATNLEIAIGVAIWIVLNTALSEWLSRRGVDFGSAVRQFAIMAGLNIGIVALAAFLFNDDSSLHFGNTLFFALLLALLITLYDRYRPMYVDRFADSAAAG
jgi:hypothetical protein